MNQKVEWQQEQERLNLVTGAIRSKLAELEPETEHQNEQAADIRKRFWEEVTVNASTFEEYEESYFTIRQQAALLADRERRERELIRQEKRLCRMLPSPYFGRVDFRGAGTAQDAPAERIYIGIASFVEDGGLKPLVYDWRSPIASLYYDGAPGKAGYDTPDGMVHGTMELKRQFQITEGLLTNMFDAGLTIGDELLQRALGQGADAQMRSIVSTIQREQNAIIRDERSRMLIVQGAAGSGKTSAALQRAAYLLYRFKDTLSSEQIVLFSPNPLFASYISAVLPELGEENLRQFTFQQFLERELAPKLTPEDPFAQLEYVLTGKGTPGYAARLEGIAYKSSSAFLEQMERYIAGLGRSGIKFRSIRFRGRELISAQQMQEKYYSYEPSIHPANRIAGLKEWLLRELNELERKERGKRWVQEEMQYLDDEAYDGAYLELNREESVFAFTDPYIDVPAKYGQGDGEETFDSFKNQERLLRSKIVKARFKPIRQKVKRLLFLDIRALYMELFAESSQAGESAGGPELPSLWPEVCRQTREKLESGSVFHEDAAPYLYLRKRMEGVTADTQVKHVFIDEGQDYSMFQYAFLKLLYPQADMTALGDFNQAIFSRTSSDWGAADSPLVRLYGPEETRIVTLSRSYRATRELTLFTGALLARSDILPFDRSGSKPLLVRCGSEDRLTRRIAADLKKLQAEGAGSIAVLTRTAAESRQLQEALTANGGGELPLRLLTKDAQHLEEGIQVLPAYLAKGVEFDAVLIADASARNYAEESERRLLYTACTRAMHRLTLYSSGAWSPLLASVDASLYEAENVE